MKIQTIDISNFRGITSLTYSPDGASVVISGNNGAGKSSFLAAIEAVLLGGNAAHAENLRRGARKGHVQIELDDAVLRLDMKAGKSAKVSLKLKDGSKPGQTARQWLKDKVAKQSFDPLAFERDKGKRGKMLREMVGLDLSADDAEIKRLMDERRDVKRDVKGADKALDAMPWHQDAPESVRDPAEIQREREAAQELHAKAEARLQQAEMAKSNAAFHRRSLETIRGDIEQVDADIARLQKRREQLESSEAEHKKGAIIFDTKAKTLATEAAGMPRPDLATFDAKLQGLHEDNRKVRENASRDAAHKRLQELEAQVSDLTDSIEEARDAKLEKIAACEFPVEGLGFNDDGEVTYRGMDFDANTSQSDRLRISMAIAVAQHPELNIALLPDASRFDAEHLQRIIDLAAEHDAQVFVEVVGESANPRAIQLVDGTLKND